MSAFAADDDLDALRGVVAEFLDRVVGRPTADGPTAGDADDQWARASKELGLAGLLAPAGHGGAGAGWRAMSVVLEESGARLWRAPLLASAALAVSLLACSRHPVAADWTQRLAEGSATGAPMMALGGVEPSVAVDGAGAPGVGDAVRLTVAPTTVLDGATADLLLVLCHRDGLELLVAVDAASEGVAAAPTRTLDLTRPQARTTLDGAQGVVLATGQRPRRLARRLLLAALAAEQAGGIAACLHASVDYAKQREQFGRPIGAFQAIRHRCAQMLIERERTTSLLVQAAWAVEQGLDTVDSDVSAAAAVCGPAFEWVAAETIQVHGGLGFTWEHPAHLYYRRAIGNRLLAGRVADHHSDVARARLATLRVAATSPRQGEGS